MAWDPISLTPPQYVDTNGDPYSGAVLKFYTAGTTTNINLATDSTGGTTASDVALNSDGFPEISGNTVIPHLDRKYKVALYPTQAAADADSGADWTIDNITPGLSGEEWEDSGDTLTVTSARAFTVPGDETSAYHVGRRLQITHDGGTDYYTIVSSAYTTLTTVAVAGTGDLTGSSATCKVSVLRADNPSVPQVQTGTATAASTMTMPTSSMVEISGATAITKFEAFEADIVTTFYCGSAVTITHDGDYIDIPGGQNLLMLAGESFQAYQYDEDGSGNAKVRVIGKINPSLAMQFVDLSGDQTTDVTVAAGYDYQLDFFGEPTTDCSVYIRVTNDGGTNWTDQSGDVVSTYLASDGATSVSVNALGTDLGARVNYWVVEGTGSFPLSAKALLQGRTGSQSNYLAWCTHQRDTGVWVHNYNASRFTAHSDGINGIRLYLTAGTWSSGHLRVTQLQQEA